MPLPKPFALRLAQVARVAVALLCLIASASVAQPVQSASLDATALVRHAVQHRIESAQNHQPLEYLLHRIDERHNSTKTIIETQDGDVARLIAINDAPLPTDANQAELDRLNTLAQHPELQARRRRSEDKDRERITHLLGLLPDAFIYHYEGTTPCSSGQCYRLSFTPNPHWTPPDIEANLFRGLAGEIWIDQSQECLVRLDGRFIAEVDFGLGFIGRIDKGGTVLLEQSDVGSNDWELTNLVIHVTGKAFLFKSFTYQVTERTSRYISVSPGLRYRDAIDLLEHLNLSSTIR